MWETSGFRWNYICVPLRVNKQSVLISVSLPDQYNDIIYNGEI